MRSSIGVLIVALCALVVSLNAQPEIPGPAAKLIKKLNLTEQQKPELGKLMVEHAKKMIDQRAKFASNAIDLRVLLRAESPQQNAIEKKMRELADLKVQEETLRLNLWFSVNKLLTVDQQKVWKNALQEPMKYRAQGQARGMKKNFKGPRDRDDRD